MYRGPGKSFLHLLKEELGIYGPFPEPLNWEGGWCCDLVGGIQECY